MKKFFVFSLLSIVLFELASCSNKQVDCGEVQVGTYGDSDHLINATLWMQHSAEYRACCLQTYKFAKLALSENLKNKVTDKIPAVVLDIDETVLDNSNYEAYMAINSTSFSDSTWFAWTSSESAGEVPGATDFLKYAHELGVEIFFVTNRYESELQSTMNNMKDLGFPPIPEDHFYLKTDSSNKDSRRAAVAENYEIIMFVGDNMGDFEGAFDNRKVLGDMYNEVANIYDNLGTHYIVLPNPTYGTWEKPILAADTAVDARQNRINALRSF